MFTLKDRRYAVNGAELRATRLALGLKTCAVASACGWSTQYQCRLEHSGNGGREMAVSETVKNLLESVFAEAARKEQGKDAGTKGLTGA